MTNVDNAALSIIFVVCGIAFGFVMLIDKVTHAILAELREIKELVRRKS